jgi:poly(3-hydroxybutyrate) depolymerase
MDAKYYIETVEEVFQKHSLPLGNLKLNDIIIKPELISNCKLLTIEGENDDICGLGQTYAAHDLCINIKDKKHHVINGVGHYGVFSGKKWKEEIYPLINSFIKE